MDVKKVLEKYNIEPDKTKDQYFLTDNNILKKIVDLAELNKSDVVFEIGAGVGNLSREIALRVKKLITFEIDDRFKKPLKDLPKNTEIHFENAWDYAQLHGKFYKRKIYNKIVSNIPYSFAEQFLHNLTFLNYDKVILLVPKKFINSIKNSGIFSSFFDPQIKMVVDKKYFYPVPSTNSVIVNLVKLPDPLKTKNLGMFLRRYMYQHEQQLVKNSLMEGIILFARKTFKKDVTKNQAREFIKKQSLDKGLLEEIPNSKEIYFEVGEKFKNKDLRNYLGNI